MTPLNIGQTIRLARCCARQAPAAARGALPAAIGWLRDIGRARRIAVQVVPTPGRNYLLSLLAEFRRATVAAKRYEDLQYRSAGHGLAPDDIPRRIFDEVYAAEEGVEPHRPGGRSEAPPSRLAKALP